MRGKWCAQFDRGIALAATPVVKERSAAVNGSGVADQATTDYLLTANPARLAADTRGFALTFAPTNFAGAAIRRGVRTVAKARSGLGALEVLADERVTVPFNGLPRKVYARGHAPAVRWYADLTLPCGHAHTELLPSSKDGARTGFSRPERLRMRPPGTPVHTKTYGWQRRRVVPLPA